MIRFSGLLNIFKSKYLISFAVFAVWIIFFDRNDLITQWDRKQELQKLDSSTTFYEKEIANTKRDLMDLNNKPAILEKFAREKFYFKRHNEEIFLVDDSSNKKN
ncbi:MAG TPA: septum formation initiator family protein [Segetibacter sp.]